MWNLRNKTDEDGGRGKKREANYKRLLTIENKQMLTTGEVGGEMGEITEGD